MSWGRVTSTPAVMADVYLRAIDVLAERGWTQGSWEEGGSVCMDGAVRAACGLPASLASGYSPDQRDAALLWIDCRIELERRLDWAVMFWNDESGRTAEDVILALKQAAYDLTDDAP